jgi:aconitate hydratase
MKNQKDHFGSRATLSSRAGNLTIYRLDTLARQNLADLHSMPFSIKVLLESALRNVDDFEITADDVKRLAAYDPTAVKPEELPFKPARVILQDFTGVPAVVDLAAMRAAMSRAGGDPQRINPLIPVDLVIDHSVQVDEYGSSAALLINARKEFERNRERYEFLKWGQRAFRNFSVVPPATGIVHQVNLEYLATVVATRDGVAFPDSLVGTDSHTTMINGLGVVGWGVGGIEAEACMLGQPIYMVTPQVVGFRLHGQLPEGATATDLVLAVTQILRGHGVVEKFVEFFGDGLETMTVADRATIANMAPEYGATVGFFPVDEQVLRYLRLTGRSDDLIDLVERYCKEQGLWRQRNSTPSFSEVLELDLGTIVPSLAGPRRPQDRVDLPRVGESFRKALTDTFRKTEGSADNRLERLQRMSSAARPASDTSSIAVLDESRLDLRHGDVVIAAITSCTNTSNPSVMVAAGLLARKAVEAGLRVPPFVKTSLAPGSRVVSDYLAKSGLDRYLDALGFQTVGYGCTTCIGNSGPLPEAVASLVERNDLVVSAVLSGNRNFEGRINPHVRANYLASPPLVVAFALAGSVNVNLAEEPLGLGTGGRPVYLRDIWPTQAEIARTVESCLSGEMFRRQYANVGSGNAEWNDVPVRGGELFEWDPASTYIQEPPFFVDLSRQVPPIRPIMGARVLVSVGDSVTTDHISPAGSIKKDSPAGAFLMSHGIRPIDFNSYGSRRGDWRVMTRGTFANIRLRNLLAPGTEGGVTVHLPSGQQMSIFDAAEKYRHEKVPLIVLAGKDYGMGSSRDWAAKGVQLLGVRAVIAESFERIHRSNLVGMGVLPLVYENGQNLRSLGLSGREIFDLPDLSDSIRPRQAMRVIARDDSGRQTMFMAICRIDTPVELEYYRHGGILHRVLRQMLGA